MMKHRLKIIKEIFVNPIAMTLAIFVGVMGAIPVFIWFVSLILGLQSDLNSGIMEGLSNFIETYRLYFCVSPFIIIPFILAEGMYRKARRFLGEDIPITYKIESNRNSDYKVYDKDTGKLHHTETSLDLIFTNKEKTELILYGNIVSFKCVDKSGIEKDILKKVNPNNSNIGWNGNKIFDNVVIGKKGKQATINIIRSQYPYNSFKLLEDIWFPSDEGSYEFEIAINGKSNGIPIEEIPYRDYFVLSKRIMEIGEDGIAPVDARLHPDEEPIQGWKDKIEFIRFGFAKPVSKIEFV